MNLPSLLLLLVLLVVALISAGCNVIRIRGAQLNHAFDRAGLTQRELPLSEGSLSFREGGRGDPVLLLHGFGASSVWQWQPQLAALTPRHRVIVPDLLWFGASRGAPGAFTLEAQVEAVLAMLDFLGVEKLDVVGMSYGGMVAWRLATLHPERVGKLVLVASPGPAYLPADFEALKARFAHLEPEELFVPSRQETVQTLIDLAWYRPPRAPAFARKQVIRDLYGTFREEKLALIGSLRSLLGALPDPPHPLPWPVLLLWGRQDPVFPLEMAERLHTLLGEGCQLHIIEKARHAPNLERVREFNRALVRFLEGRAEGVEK